MKLIETLFSLSLNRGVALIQENTLILPIPDLANSSIPNVD